MNQAEERPSGDSGGELSVLRNRNFTLLWIGLIVSNSGSWMTLVGQGWLVYQLTGSALALGVVGVAGAFYFDGLSFLAVVAALFAMKGVPEHGARRGPKGSFTGDLKAGLSYVRSTPLLLTLILMSTIAGVFGRSFQQFLPVFAKA